MLAMGLQWGHAFVSVETSRSLASCVVVRGASMGPRFCKRGNGGPIKRPKRRDDASMGPRFCKRGNDIGAALFGPAPMLQWGHAFVSVETRLRDMAITTDQLLQWGHAFVSVETHPIPHPHPPPPRFNGATLL